jgi:D-alanyl-D-alanine dipeptidase
MRNYWLIGLLVLVFGWQCMDAPSESQPDLPPSEAPDTVTRDSQVSYPEPAAYKNLAVNPIGKAGFVDMQEMSNQIIQDIRYATDNNFTKSTIYDCPACLLRPDAADALIQAQELVAKRSLRIKVFDCYRPRPYQQRLWDKVPDPNYVTPPSKGSMHSRGAAVDMTLIDRDGKELDMGTPYDFFGKEAHTDYTDLPREVLENRQYLRETMEAVGYKGIRTEWWHFSFRKKQYPLSSFVWPCD